MMPLSALRAEADMAARNLPRLRLTGQAVQAAQLGSAGRRRAGSGEQFWQYRRHMPEDSSTQVDWRRSARGDTLFVRETELESARTLLFWIDPHKGFAWASQPGRVTKAERACVLALSMAILLSREGERVGTLAGRPPGFGRKAVDRFGEDLLDIEAAFPSPPKRAANLILFSDFYDPIDVWKRRLAPLAAKCRTGLLVAISDPIEEHFPFRGRVKFARPGSTLSQLMGRAEAVRADYQTRYQAHQAALTALASELGWQYVRHRTDEPMMTGAARLHQRIEQLGIVT